MRWEWIIEVDEDEVDKQVEVLEQKIFQVDEEVDEEVIFFCFRNVSLMLSSTIHLTPPSLTARESDDRAPCTHTRDTHVCTHVGESQISHARMQTHMNPLARKRMLFKARVCACEYMHTNSYGCTNMSVCIHVGKYHTHARKRSSICVQDSTHACTAHTFECTSVRTAPLLQNLQISATSPEVPNSLLATADTEVQAIQKKVRHRDVIRLCCRHVHAHDFWKSEWKYLPLHVQASPKYESVGEMYPKFAPWKAQWSSRTTRAAPILPQLHTGCPPLQLCILFENDRRGKALVSTPAQQQGYSLCPRQSDTQAAPASLLRLPQIHQEAAWIYLGHRPADSTTNRFF